MMTGRATRFEEIRVGESLPPLHKTVSVEQIRRYAQASGDHNPIHLDQAFARSAGLPGVIAHGMLTMAFVDQMVTEKLPNDVLKANTIILGGTMNVTNLAGTLASGDGARGEDRVERAGE